MRIKIKVIYLFLLTIFINSCSTDDTPVNLPEGEAEISAQIEEVQWQTTEFESALNVIPGKGQFFELTASGGDYRLNLSVLEFDKSNGIISEGTYQEDDNFYLNLFLLDEEGNALVEYRPVDPEENTGSLVEITITASSNSRISGNFSGMLYKVSAEEEEYPDFLRITNGMFNNLPFETHTVNIQ